MTLSFRHLVVPFLFVCSIGFLGASSVAYGAKDPLASSMATTYRVDGTNGTDQAGCGTGANPDCKTISFLLGDANFNSGDSLLIEPGIYRETVTFTSDHNGIIVEGDAPGVYIYGSEKPEDDPSFTQNGSVYTVVWNGDFDYTNLNNGGLCGNLTDDISEWRSCHTIGFWQDGELMTQVENVGDVVDGTFHYNVGTDLVTLKPIAGNSNLAGIEGLFRTLVVEFEPSSSNITLRNVNIWYGASRAKKGILLVDGTDHLVEDVDVRYSAGGGVNVDAGALRITMDNVTASQHGQIGWRVGSEGAAGGDVVDLTVTNSVSKFNGWKLFDNCWEGGGTKFSFTENLVLDGFYASDNDGFGIWLDIQNNAYDIKNSMSARDKGRGIFIEAGSSNGTVQDNVVFKTGDAGYVGCAHPGYGIGISGSSGVTIKNNTIYSTESGVEPFYLKNSVNNLTWDDNLVINRLDTGVRIDGLSSSEVGALNMASTYIEERSGSNTVGCWGAGASHVKCTTTNGSALNITNKTESTGYLDDENDECGFKVVDSSLLGIGAPASFVHPRDAEVCGGSSNTPPVTTISAPANNQAFDVGDAITIMAAATDSDGTIATMEVFTDENLLGSSTVSSITETWTGASIGSHTIRVRATDDDGAFDDETITITVNDTTSTGNGAFIESGGLVVMEAENYDTNITSSQSGDTWTLVENFNGADAMQPQVDDDNANINNNYNNTSAELGYEVNFTTTGTYYVWLRAWAIPNGNSAHVGINDVADPNGKNFSIAPVPSVAWDWEKTLGGGAVAKIVVSTAGIHTFNLWMKEDGLYVDRIILTTDANYPTPSGVGPAESPRSNGNVDPTVTITAPNDNDSFTVNTSITVSADASDSDGTIASVEFFADGASIGSDTGSPYSVNWTPTVDGAVVLTAVATDNEGATTTSAVVNVTIDPAGTGPFIESGGLVVMEAENFDTNIASSQSGDVWTLVQGFNSADAMQPQVDDDNANINNNYQNTSAELGYQVDFTTTGTYYVWIRAWALSNGNSAHVGLDDVADPNGKNLSVSPVPSVGWDWEETLGNGADAKIVVSTAGVHTFNLWMKEDGLYVDRIILTTDANYPAPSGVGPAESSRGSGGGSAAAPDSRGILITGDEASFQAIPETFTLHGNYPNPFNPTTNLIFDLPQDADVAVAVFDILGRQVMQIENERILAGASQQLTLDAGHLPSGTYLYRLIVQMDAQTEIHTGRLLLLK